MNLEAFYLKYRWASESLLRLFETPVVLSHSSLLYVVATAVKRARRLANLSPFKWLTLRLSFTYCLERAFAFSFWHLPRAPRYGCSFLKP